MSKSGFCWADEVEKEEAEESEIRLREQKKPNPFGSARPREVVLQDKGIDWRKLDEKLHQPSFARKENTGPEQSIKPIEWGDGIGSPLNQEPTVPPLRYPPKNIMTLLKENQWPNFVMPKGVNTTSPQGRRRFIDEEEIRERELGGMDFEYSGERFFEGRNDARERARRRSPSVNAERIGYHHMYMEARSVEYFRDAGVRPLEDCENMDYVYGRQRFDRRELERPQSERRPQFRRDAYMEGGFGVNKRRGIEFGSNNSRDYQRRRK